MLFTGHWTSHVSLYVTSTGRQWQQSVVMTLLRYTSVWLGKNTHISQVSLLLYYRGFSKSKCFHHVFLLSGFLLNSRGRGNVATESKILSSLLVWYTWLTHVLKVSKLCEFTWGCWSHASETTTIISSGDAAGRRMTGFLFYCWWVFDVYGIWQCWKVWRDWLISALNSNTSGFRNTSTWMLGGHHLHRKICQDVQSCL